MLIWIYIHPNILHSLNIDIGKTCLNGNVIEWLIYPHWKIQSHTLVNENGQSRNWVGVRGSSDSLFLYEIAEGF